MKIVADLSACQGYANCVIAAGEYFDITDDGKVTALVDVVAAGDISTVEEAVRSCPVAALSLEEA